MSFNPKFTTPKVATTDRSRPMKDPSDFREMKAEYTAKLESKLTNFNDPENIEPVLRKGLYSLLKLDFIYQAGDIEKKREVISSMYPEKLTFDGNALRTTRVNEAVHFIYMMNSDLEAKKTGQLEKIPSCPVKSG